jgi:hypothetical protein
VPSASERRTSLSMSDVCCRSICPIDLNPVDRYWVRVPQNARSGPDGTASGDFLLYQLT